MQYRPMGSLDWNVSALGFGAMRLPTRPLNRLKIDEREAVRILRRGIDLGIDYVDTAWFYQLGDSERVLGRALADGYRERVKLVTKLPVMLCRKPEDFERYLTQQLERLKTDHLDCYLLHSLDRASWEKAKRLGFLEAAERAREQGLIRHFGFSFHDTLPVFREIVDHRDWDLCQIQLNYMDTGLQAGIEGLEYAASKGIAVVIMEPVKGGQLANPPGEALQIMRESGIDRTPVDWALQFLWDRPEVSVVLSGMGSMRMVEENCASADRSGVGALTPEERSVIERVAEIYRSKIVVPCTACRYCMPCPEGVDIPQNFAILNNLAMDAKFHHHVWRRRDYRKLAKTRERVSKDRPNGAATLCTECGACVPMCPQHIDIPERLKLVEPAVRKRS